MDKPKKTFRAGPIQASVFMNARKVDGKSTEIPSVNFQKRYLDAGEWKTTNSLNLADLPRAVLVLWKAYDYILGLRSEVVADEEGQSGIEVSDN